MARLLGAVEVILDGHRLRTFNSLRLQRFLALLTLRDDLQHRSRIAYELWPDSDERQARTNLRKLLHDFRHGLPAADEFVEITSDTVRWVKNGPAEIDVLRFREAIAVGDLELAARLYSGDLLPACYDSWVLAERAKLRREAHVALVRLTNDATARGDHQAAIRYAQRATDLEPTDEVSVRIQMKAYLAIGDRAAGLRVYHRFSRVLERELAAAPGEAVYALYQELRRRSRAVQREEALPVSESPFVGREEESSRLYEAWRTASAGRPHVLLVTGEPGIGKSRLALELARRVRAEGHVVASTRAFGAAGRLPWGPVVDLLRSDELRKNIDTLDDVWRTELTRLMPELDAERPSEPARPGDPTQRHRLFDAVSRAVLAGDRPRLLVFDDLQWCDAETIELIGFVVRSGGSARVLVVGTVRSEEISELHPLVRLVDALEHDDAVTTLPLDPLDEDCTTRLAARLRGESAIDPAFAARLFQETEGNPLFLIEAIRSGIDPDEHQTVLTSTMRAVLGARLDQLTNGAKRVMELAATIGRAFPVSILAAAAGTDEAELVDELDELWHRRIIRDQGVTYDFSHDKLRAVALERISPARRRLLHRAVAEALAAERTDADSPSLAAHYDQAGMIGPAVDAYLAAGAQAVAVSAPEEAVSMFRRALALISELPASRDRDQLELHIRIALGSPLVALEGYGSPDAHQLYERAHTLCRRLQRPVDAPILRGLGLARLQGCRFGDCDEFAQALLDKELDPTAITEGHYLLGVSAFWQGDLTNARQHLNGAINTYDVSKSAQHIRLFAQDPKAVCLVRRALVELWTGDAEQAQESLRSALALADGLDHLMTRAYVLTYAAIHASESEDIAGLAELLRDAESVWTRLPDRYLVLLLDALRGYLEVSEDSPDGVERIVSSVAASRTDGETLHLTYTLLLLARARGMTGEFDEGRAATREALAWTERRRQHYLEAELWRVDGELAYRSGLREDAASSLRRAARTASVQGARLQELRALHSLATRFPEVDLKERITAALEAMPGGHDLEAFRVAAALLSESD